MQARRLRDPEDLGEIAHACLADLVEHVEEPQARRLSDHVEHRGALVEVGRELHRLLPALQ
jgi:hypothetical protein